MKKYICIFAAVCMIFSILSTAVYSEGLGSVKTIQNLREYATPEDGQAVLLQGYYESNDGGGGLFFYDKSSSDTDNGGTVIASNYGGCWKRLLNDGTVSVKWFGAKGNGASDDISAIQNAIDCLPNSGGTVYFPAGSYGVSKTVQIGDGDGAEKFSSKNAVKLIGEGAGFADPSVIPTIIFPTAEFETLISVNGRISDITIEGMMLYCDLKTDTALSMTAVSGCTVKNVILKQYSKVGLKLMGGNAPIGNYNIFNTFSQINAISLQNNHIGLLIDGDYTAHNDTWITTFTACRFDTVNSSNSTAAYFKFVDSISFYRCHFVGTGRYARGLVFDATNNPSFPAGMAFYDCSIINTNVIETDTNKIRKNYFYGYGTYDNELIPRHSSLIGITDTGVFFNIENNAEIPLIKGDTNNDGNVSLNDAMLCFNFVSGKAKPTLLQQKLCDTDADGKIMLNDAMYIFRKVAGKF